MKTGRHIFRFWLLPMLLIGYVVAVGIGTLIKLFAPAVNPPLWGRVLDWPEVFYGPALMVISIGVLLWTGLWLSDLVSGRGR